MGKRHLFNHKINQQLNNKCSPKLNNFTKNNGKLISRKITSPSEKHETLANLFSRDCDELSLFEEPFGISEPINL